MRKRGWLIWLGSALMLGGAVLLAWYSWALYRGAAAQRLAKEWLNRTTGLHRPAPAVSVRHGDVIGELEIPRLQLSVMVFEGDDAESSDTGRGTYRVHRFPPAAATSESQRIATPTSAHCASFIQTTCLS
jgi:sortase (surface protein transpeptidase)